MTTTFRQTRLRFLLNTPLMYGATESGIEFDANLPRYIRITDIRSDGTLEPDNAVSLACEIARPYLLNDHDVLLARSGATVGKAFLYRSSESEACFAGYLIRARCDQHKLLPEYLFYFLQSAGYWNFIKRSALQATIQNVSAELYKEVAVTHPSLDAQQRTVAYLDEATGKIDRLVALRRRQVELLKEQRAALIQEAVTRGLDPNAPLKDSGLPWLGRIPKHWQINRLRRVIVALQTGPFGSQIHQSDYVEDGIPLVNPCHMSDGRIVPDRNVAVSPDFQRKFAQYVLHTGDIVFARRGELGRCALVTEVENGWICGTGSFRVAGCPKKIAPQYLLALFLWSSASKWLDLYSGRATMDSLSAEQLANTPGPLPKWGDRRPHLSYDVPGAIRVRMQLQSSLSRPDHESSHGK